MHACKKIYFRKERDNVRECLYALEEIVRERVRESECMLERER